MNLNLLAVNLDNFGVADGAVVAVTGILTVIFILALIAFVISVAAKIIYYFEHKDERQILRKAAKPEAPVQAPQTAAEETAEAVTDSVSDDLELIAVITAAIAAGSGVSSDRLVVRSLRKSSNWQNEAIQEQISRTIVV